MELDSVKFDAAGSPAVDRESALEAFHAYAGSYDLGNPRIKLKYDHTLRVAELCGRIARSLALPEDGIDLAWLLGLLHDIGRFEQVRRYDTFNDAATVNHAALGVEVLFEPRAAEGASAAAATAIAGDGAIATAVRDGAASSSAAASGPAATSVAPNPLIRTFVADEACDQLIRDAVGMHSAYRLPDDLDARTRLFCNILRDADKIDIIKVNCTCPIEDIYGVPERRMAESVLSPECVETFFQHRCLPRGIRRYPADIMLGHICFVWELVFAESIRIVREQGFLDQMLDRTWENPATQEAFDAMAAHMRKALGEDGGGN